LNWSAGRNAGAPLLSEDNQLMRTLLPISLLCALLAACGGDRKPVASTPTPAGTVKDEHELEGYSQGVIDYYGDPHEHADDESGNIEAQYHKPPSPAEAGLGETITLTATNIGVRLKVTVTAVEPVRDRYTAVKLHLVNDGIAIFESELTSATLTGADGTTRDLEVGAKAACSNGFDEPLRLDVGDEASGCLLFKGNADATRFQLALEQIPVTAGAIWNLG
jgi:hypothetical protein